MLNWVKDKCEEYESIYQIIGGLGLFNAIMYMLSGFVQGTSNTLIYEDFNTSKISIILMYIYEIAEVILCIVPIFMAFIHDLCYEKQPRHLVIALLLELFIFSLLKFFRILGGNLLLFIGIGIILCFVIGGSSAGIVLLFDWAITGGAAFLTPLIGFIGPLLLIGILLTSIAEFFRYIIKNIL